ncbi:MAG: hypothetical protein R3F34_05710 [Planctomycetota bacterium]
MTYTVDERDVVVSSDALPAPDFGAPLPHVVADGYRTCVVYVEHVPDPSWDGTYARVVGPDSEDENLVVATFEGCLSVLFGMPNDEALAGHPLATRGLCPCGVFEIRESSWIRELDNRNAVHSRHRRGLWCTTFRHFVVTFHDSTFECVARTVAFERVRGSVARVLEEQARAIHRTN